MGRLYPVCTVCGHTPKLGIMDGIVVYASFICHDCEARILHLTPNDPELLIIQGILAKKTEKRLKKEKYKSQSKSRRY